MSNKIQLRPALDPQENRRTRRRIIASAGIAAGLGGVVSGLLLVSGAALTIAALRTTDVRTANLPSSPPQIAAPPVAQVSPSPSPETSASPPQIARTALVVHADVPYLVIESIASGDWLTGEPRLLNESEYSYSIASTVNDTKLPRSLTRLVGQPVSAFDSDGKRCVGEVGALSAIRIIHGIPLDDLEGTTVSDAWGWGEPMLVASLDGISDDCESLAGALIGRDDFVSTAMLPLSQTDPLAAEAIAEWKSEHGWQSIQNRFANLADATGDWDQDSAPQVTLIGSRANGLVVVSQTVGGCGEFEGSLTTAYRLDDAGLDSAIPIPAGASFDLSLAADANGDGMPELFVNGGYADIETLESSRAMGFVLRDGPVIDWQHCSC